MKSRWISKEQVATWRREWEDGHTKFVGDALDALDELLVENQEETLASNVSTPTDPTHGSLGAHKWRQLNADGWAVVRKERLEALVTLYQTEYDRRRQMLSADESAALDEAAEKIVTRLEQMEATDRA